MQPSKPSLLTRALDKSRRTSLATPHDLVIMDGGIKTVTDVIVDDGGMIRHGRHWCSQECQIYIGRSKMSQTKSYPFSSLECGLAGFSPEMKLNVLGHPWTFSSTLINFTSDSLVRVNSNTHCIRLVTHPANLKARARDRGVQV